MYKRNFFIITALVFVQSLWASEVIWEQNIKVHKVEPGDLNQYTIAPIKVDLNSADQSQLIQLDGIGPKKAEAIINFRQSYGYFKTVNDLGKIKGFSKKILSHIIEKNKEKLVITQP